MNRLFDLSEFSLDQLRQLVLEANEEIHIREEAEQERVEREKQRIQAATEFCVETLKKNGTDEKLRVFKYPTHNMYVVTGFKEQKDGSDQYVSGWAAINEHLIWDSPRLIAQDQSILGTKEKKNIRKAFAIELLEGDILKVMGIPSFGHDARVNDYYVYKDGDLQAIDERDYKERLRAFKSSAK